MQTQRKEPLTRVVNLEAQTLAFWMISRAHNQAPDSPSMSIGDAINGLTDIAECLSPARPISGRTFALLQHIIEGS